MSLLGDALIAGGKAEKLVGDDMSPSMIRKQLRAENYEKEHGPSVEEIQWQMDLKMKIGYDIILVSIDYSILMVLFSFTFSLNSTIALMNTFTRRRKSIRMLR